jgi:hypothetical protein
VQEASGAVDDVVVCFNGFDDRKLAYVDAVREVPSFETGSLAESMQELKDDVINNGRHFAVIITEIEVPDLVDGLDEIRAHCQTVASEYPSVIVLSDRSSDDRLDLLRARGAKIVRVDGNELRTVQELVETELSRIKALSLCKYNRHSVALWRS